MTPAAPDSHSTRLHHVHRGSGPQLLAIHGLGGNWRSWTPILDDLASEREVIAVDLPGFGDTPALPGPPTIAAHADALEQFIAEHDLDGVACVGSSMGARLALELARRGAVGPTVALDPGGFWNRREVRYFETSVATSVKLMRPLAGALPKLTGNPISRTALLPQFSARPWALDGDFVLGELQAFLATDVFESTLHELAQGPTQDGAAETRGPVVIGWGRGDRVCFPRQAVTAANRFPAARLHWFEHCGHFPHWDQPEATVRLVLEATAPTERKSSAPTPIERSSVSKEANIASQEHLADNINSGDVATAVESFAEDCVDHDPAPGQEPGRKGFESFFTALREGFPDAKIAPETLVADGDQVAVAYTLSGTHEGEFQGIEPTHRKIEIRGVQIGRFEDGKIVERWGASDELGILKQLGAAPEAR